MDRLLGLDHVQFSHLTFLFYIVILLPAMLIGFFFARRKMFRPHHKLLMTFVTLANWFLILFHMLLSYFAFVAPAEMGGPLGDPVGRPGNLIPSIHLVTGAAAQILATWMVLLMWTEKTRAAFVVPAPLRIRNIKPVMRTTLALWLVTTALGALVYLTWYPPVATATDTGTPVVTEEPAPAATSAADPSAATEEAPGEAVATEEVATTPEP